MSRKVGNIAEDKAVSFLEKNGFKKLHDKLNTTKLKGSGLGMAIVHNIIEQHDGRIFVGNIEPHGAVITIEFDYIDNNKKE